MSCADLYETDYLKLFIHIQKSFSHYTHTHYSILSSANRIRSSRTYTQNQQNLNTGHFGNLHVRHNGWLTTEHRSKQKPSGLGSRMLTYIYIYTHNELKPNE